jgi:hypothetical protein
MTNDQDAFKVFDLIFSEEPKEPNTYNLRLDTTNPENESVLLDDILINLFFTGLKILFGEECNLQNITQDQFILINKYMSSFGFKTILDYEYDDNNLPVHVKIWFDKYDN